jgi:hypothetical protein
VGLASESDATKWRGSLVVRQHMGLIHRGLYHAKQNPSSKEYLMLLFDFLQNNTTKMAVVFIIYN